MMNTVFNWAIYFQICHYYHLQNSEEEIALSSQNILQQNAIIGAPASHSITQGVDNAKR
jgi:hypothetical protein